MRHRDRRPAGKAGDHAEVESVDLVRRALVVDDLTAEHARENLQGPFEPVDSASRKLPVLTRRVAALTQREPENAAHLLRTWLAEDER